MKVAELIDALQEVDRDKELTFRVVGNVSAKQEMEGRYYGVYDVAIDVDRETDDVDIDGAGVTVWL